MKKTNYNRLFKEGKTFYTRSLILPAESVYGETIYGDYREWVPKRSKLGSAIYKNLRTFPFRDNSKVLYLGCSSGTTCSHLSDIVVDGVIFGVDIAPRIFYKFVELSKKRKNLFPILADANKPKEYEYIPKVDVIFQDVAQKNQVEIFQKNMDKFLKSGGVGFLALKARSIDVTRRPQEIFDKVRRELKRKYTLMEERSLYPYEKDHVLFVVKKR